MRGENSAGFKKVKITLEFAVRIGYNTKVDKPV